MRAIVNHKNASMMWGSYCILALLLLFGATLSGCVKSNDIVLKDDCQFYPDNMYMEETWGSKADRSVKDYDAVTFMVEPWDPNRHDWNASELPYVDWDKFPGGSRPGIVVDSLCLARGKDLFEDTPAKNAMGGGITAEYIAEDAMETLRKETERQTGENPDHCCAILFMDVHYAVGYMWHHVTRADGSHIGERDIHRHEGKINRSVYHNHESIYHEGQRPYEFYVKPAAKLFHVEAAWDHDLYSLDLLLEGPERDGDQIEYRVEGGSLGEPKGTLNLTIFRDQEESWSGDWRVTMEPTEMAVDVEYTVIVTIFNWEKNMPEGYSAL